MKTRQGSSSICRAAEVPVKGAPMRQDYSAYSDLVFMRLLLLFEALLGDLLLFIFGCCLEPASRRHCLQGWIRNAIITRALAWRGLLQRLQGFCTADSPASSSACSRKLWPATWSDTPDIKTEGNVHVFIIKTRTSRCDA